MKITHIKELKEGDKIRHRSDPTNLYTVTANYGDHVTAVKTVDVTNAPEWELVSQAAYRLTNE
jgi:spermidine/putrescine-binding protein